MISSPRLLLSLGGAAALLLAVGVSFTVGVPLRADGGSARDLVARSEAAFAGGNHSLARQLAREAVAADPGLAAARLALARAALGEGDGISAEADVLKARDAGAAGKATEHLYAHARLLQGDAQGALRHARAADAAGWAYGLRVQAQALAALGNAAAANDLFDRALRRAPRDGALWVDLGRFRRSTGDDAGAIAAASRAVALNPNDLDALLLRAQTVRGQFGLAGALPWFEAALQRDPHSYAALIDYAATLGDAGRARDMLAATRRALAARPGDPQALYLLAVLAARAGNSELARGMLAKAGDALAGLPGPLLLGATLDIDSGAHEQAVTKLRNLVAIQPMNLAARQLLAGALLRSGAARDALEVLWPVATRGDADSYTLTLAARALEASGDRAAAAAMLDRAARPARGGAGYFGADDSVGVLAAAAGAAPEGDPSGAIPLIRAQLDSADGAGALARAQAVARANPGSPQAAVVLGDTLMALGRPRDAVAPYRRAADIRFDEPTMLRLTEALERGGDPRGAADALALFVSQNPGNVAAQRLAAHWQIAGGELDAAIATLEGLRARIGNRDAALLAGLAYANDGAGDAEAARRYAAAAYALAPMNPAVADAYGWSLYRAGDLDGALQLLQKAVTIAPGHAVLRWHLAQVYVDLGRAAEARLHATAALSDPRFGDRDAARALIARLG